MLPKIINGYRGSQRDFGWVFAMKRSQKKEKINTGLCTRCMSCLACRGISKTKSQSKLCEKLGIKVCLSVMTHAHTVFTAIVMLGEQFFTCFT